MTRPDQNLVIQPGAIKQAVLSAYRFDTRGGSNHDSSITGESQLSHSIIFRETCQYCILSNTILGSLTLTRESLTFEPDLRDVNVGEKCIGLYQVHVDLQNILECGCIGGPSQELTSLEDTRCNGFLQVLVRSSEASTTSTSHEGLSFESTNDEVDHYPITDSKFKHRSIFSAGLMKLSSAVNIALSSNGKYKSTSFSSRGEYSPIFILFGFFNKETAHHCTSLLMNILDLYRTRSIIPKHIGITKIPFSSNSLIDSWAIENRRLSNNGENLVKDKITSKAHCEFIAKKSNILSSRMVEELIEHLPPSIAIRDWILSFEIDHDGISFQTFYKKLSNKLNCLILIQDTDGTKFGAFTGPIYSNFKFYGSGETFVFRFTDNTIKVFRSKAKNRCFIFSNDGNIIIGGGDRPAIAIGDGFICGSSGPSDTFGNEQLSNKRNFSIKYMEVWTFGNFIT